MNLGLEEFEVRFFRIYVWIWFISDPAGLKFMHLEGVQKGLKWV